MASPKIPQEWTPDNPYSDLLGQVDAQMRGLGKAPFDYGQIVDYNNRASALAAAIDRDFQQQSAREAMAFDAEQAQINRDWQEMMSATAYQRATEDMRNAGINPILAYTQGGAATTSGATASGHSASGSSARGVSASGSRSSVDMNTTSDIIRQVISSATSIGNNVLNLGQDFMRSVGSIVSKFKK